MKLNLRYLILAGLAIVTVTGAAACSAGKATTQQEKITVGRGNVIQTVSADGSLSLPNQRKLTFGVDGKIELLNVKEGDKATKGQVLAKLETSTLERVVQNADLAVKLAEADRQQAQAGLLSAQADVKNAEAAVKIAAADLDQSDAGVKTAEANVLQAQNGVLVAQSTLEQAKDAVLRITYPFTYTTFSLDIPQAVTDINEAQRQVNEALDNLKTGTTPEQINLATTSLKKAVDNLASAQGRLTRGQGVDVFASGQLNPSSYFTLRDAQLTMDKAKVAVETAASTVNVAQLGVKTAQALAAKAKLGVEVANSNVDKAKASVSNSQGLLAKSQANVDKSNHDLATAKDTLAKATITAPYDGIIAEVDVKVGDTLTPATYTQTIFQIIDPTHMEFTIKVDEMDITGVMVGQTADITLDALPNLKPVGKVMFVSPLPTVESGVVQYQVKIGFDVPAGSALKSGMSATADIIIATHNGTLTVPSRAVGRNKAGQSVVKQMVGDVVTEKVVTVGISNSTDTEILSGVNEGDTLVIETAVK